MVSATTTTRRGFCDAIAAAGLGCCALSAGALVAAAPGQAAATPEPDSELIHDASAVELLVMAVYQRVLAAGLLSTAAAAFARTMLGHERAHTRVLSLELRRFAIAPPPAPATATDVDAALAERHVSRRITKLRSEKDALRLLHDVETVAEAAYFKGIAKLRDPRLQLLSAEIMASEAQHEAVLSQLLNPTKIAKALPDAFIEGKR